MRRFVKTSLRGLQTFLSTRPRHLSGNQLTKSTFTNRSNNSKSSMVAAAGASSSLILALSWTLDNPKSLLEQERPQAFQALSAGSMLDLEKLQTDWDRFHLDSLTYLEEDDDEDDDEEDGEEDNEHEQEEVHKEEQESEDEEYQHFADDNTDIPTEMTEQEEELDKEQYPDDYSDLPEEEEETTCSICQINRQGPCRNPWRRFEKCIKSNPLQEEDQEPDAAERSRKCDHLFKPWFACFGQNRITYSMITNRQVKEDMDLIEETHGKELMPLELEPKLDKEDIQVMMMEVALDQPYVQRYIKFPLHNPATGNSIRVAYARDDKGNVLGFDYFKKELDDGKLEGDMMFHVPQSATTVTVYSFYTPSIPPNMDDNHSEEALKESAEVSSDSAANIDHPGEDLSELNTEKVYFQHISLANEP